VEDEEEAIYLFNKEEFQQEHKEWKNKKEIMIMKRAIKEKASKLAQERTIKVVKKMMQLARIKIEQKNIFNKKQAEEKEQELIKEAALEKNSMNGKK
jgi:hypothetical protein